jgi:two-component system, NarL family, nitrate/nitrite response regulator NarL
MAGEKKIRILLIDDHTIFRESLAKLLSAQPGLELQRHCGSAGEALLLLTAGVDVVLLDVDLGAERGIDVLTLARRNGFQGPVLILTAGVSNSEEELLRMQGISGILRKDVSVEVLANAIRDAAAGQLPENSALTLERRTERYKLLTPREAQVLRFVVEGHSNKEIAGEMGCSEPAVKGIVQQLFHKSGTSTRSQLVRVVLEQYRNQI